MANIIAIDFGSSNTLIKSNNSKDILFNEPTCLILDTKIKKVVEIGYLANKLIGKVPQDYSLVFPVQDGVISSVEQAKSFLLEAFKNNHLDGKIKHSTVIFSTPSNITDVEKNAIFELAKSLKIKKIYLADASKMAAIGAGINIYSTKGTMIVDIGGAKTNVSTLALGKIVKSTSINIAGNTLTNEISKYLRREHHLIVGFKTSEYLKLKIGTLLENYDNSLLEVNGKDSLTGLPTSLIISTSEINQICYKVYDQILDLMIDVLETSPAEISSDVIQGGITISGGGCLLNGVREYFQNKLSIPIHIATNPMQATIDGMIISGEKNKKDNLYL